jgi:hypothetical protein
VLRTARLHAAASSACYDNPSPENCDGQPVSGSGCDSGSYYVVQSVPLYDDYTGQYSWNYGYLQLWWSDHCQTNWGRVVINQSGRWDLFAQIWNPSFGYSLFYNGSGSGVPPGAYTSRMLYAPNDPACAITYIYPHPSGSLEFEGHNGQFSPC